MFKVNNEDTATKNYARDQLVRTQNFSKNKRILPPDTHPYVCVSRGRKC